MAKQIAGLCRLEGTFGHLTFYKMDGQYYARVKSRLTAKRVKTSPEFKITMVYARLLARASKIGAQVYKALPPGWRQFWMYRGFTGEAFTLLKENPFSDEQVKQLLWKCYIEYWEQRKVADPDNLIWQPKPQKIRKRRKYSEESLKRRMYRKDKYGRYKYPDLVKADKQRIAREAREAWAKICEEKKQLAIQQANLHKSMQEIKPIEQEPQIYKSTSQTQIPTIFKTSQPKYERPVFSLKGTHSNNAKVKRRRTNKSHKNTVHTYLCKKPPPAQSSGEGIPVYQ